MNTPNNNLGLLQGLENEQPDPANSKGQIMNNFNSTQDLKRDQEHPSGLKPNLEIAQKFLSTLSRTDQDDIFTFQVFPENSQGGLPKILHGPFEDLKGELTVANQNGCGIFVTVNCTDGKGRKKENIVAVRAIFVDLDGSPLQPILESSLEPHMILESSPERYHAYWIVEGVRNEEFTPMQKALALRFGGDSQVCDLSRVMRVPGFFHLKKTPFMSTIFNETSRLPYDRDALFAAFGLNETDSASNENATPIHQTYVLDALKRHLLLIRPMESPKGCWIIHCPWKHLHSKQDLGTKYFEPNTPEYPEGGFKCFHSHCAHKTLKDLLAYLGLHSLPKILEPLPLHRPLDDPSPFPFDALGKILMPAAMALQRVIQAPDAICGQSVLGAAALVCQPFANVFMDGRTIPLSLYLITVAESGDRKSATDKVALQPILQWQKMLSDSYREEIKRYYHSKEFWDSKKKEWLRDSTRGPFVEAPPPEPLKPLMLVEEPTYEGIVKYLAIGQPSVGLFSDEGGRFFGGHAMNRDNQLKTIAGLSSLWDGKEISRLRGGDGDMLLYGRRVSLHLMIQEVILEQLMNNRMVEHQGFLPRCLVSFPLSTAGKRPYVEEDLAIDLSIMRYYDRLNLLLDRKLPVKPYPAPQNELYPRLLHLSHSAKMEWMRYHNGIDKDLVPGGRLEQIRRFSNKAAEHVLRLAGNLAMIDRVETELIEVEEICRGITLMEYYLKEAMRIQGHLSIHPDILLAQKLLQWCWSKDKPLFSLKEIYQYGPTQIRQAAKARVLMGTLVNHGWAIPAPGAEIGGKMYREAWSVRPSSETI